MRQIVKFALVFWAFFLVLLSFTGCSRREPDFSTQPSLNNRPVTATDSAFLADYSGIVFISETVDYLFGKHVTADLGLVDYDSLWQSGLFSHLADSIGGLNPALLTSREDSFAFYINAYNVRVIELLETHTASGNRVDLSMFGKSIVVAGDTITLDLLEKNSAWVKGFNDPRSHFVLNCAAVSCPPLLDRAYRASTLYEDLDFRTKTFIRDTRFNPLDGAEKKISMLFSWYAADFAGFGRDHDAATKLGTLAGGSAVDFADSYLVDAAKRTVLQDAGLGYVDYNWEINRP